MSNDRFRFRVWDKSNKRYVDTFSDPYNRIWRWYIDIDGNLIGVEEDNVDRVQDKEKFVIEQCTGLKDKNGKLIYEGDVVVQPNQYPYWDYAENVPHKSLNDTFGVIEHDAVLNYIGIVEWDDESAQFVIVLWCVNPLKSGISNGICHCFGEDEELEIIGNVHDEQFRDLTKKWSGH